MHATSFELPNPLMSRGYQEDTTLSLGHLAAPRGARRGAAAAARACNHRIGASAHVRRPSCAGTAHFADLAASTRWRHASMTAVASVCVMVAGGSFESPLSL